MTVSTSASTRLDRPPCDIAAWTSFLQMAEIPMLARTAGLLDAARADQEGVDANGLGEIIADDPLMSLKVLKHASAHRSPRLTTEPETVIASIVMMGISPFFEAFPSEPSAESMLGDVPGALEGFRRVLRRSQRAANFALSFAVHRLDHHAAMIHATALLHGFAELLVWCHAPALAMQIQNRLQADATLRSADVQRSVLKVVLADLQRSLIATWQLPASLNPDNDDRQVAGPMVRCIALAIRLARHSEVSWDDAAVAVDVSDIAELLIVSKSAAWQLVREDDLGSHR